MPLPTADQQATHTVAQNNVAAPVQPLPIPHDGSNGDAQFDMEAYANAPQELKDAVRAFTYARQLVVGGAWRMNRKLLVSADVRQHVGEGLTVGARSHVGVGAEIRPLMFLPLRAGYARVTDGYQLGAGFGLELGPVNLSASVGRRSSAFGTDDMVAFGLTFGDR